MLTPEIRQALKEPFASDDHIERDLPGGKATWFYIPWQKIRDRLDQVCPDYEVEYGTPTYLDKYCVVDCRLTICGVTRQALGNAEIELLSRTGKDMSRGTPIERAVADAFKNAAEAFGVAAYLDHQSQDKREFTIRYLHRKGDGRAFKAAKENGWVEGNLGKPQQAEKTEAQKQWEQATKISEKQQKRLWAIANNTGYTQAGVKALIEVYGLTSTGDILASQYNEIITRLEDPAERDAFNAAAFIVKQPATA